VEPLYHEDDLLPYKVSAHESQAALTVRGNVTPNLTLNDLTQMFGLSSASDKTVWRYIDELKSVQLIRRIPPTQSEVTKKTRKSGRPITVLRFELHPTYAWCGYPEHALGYYSTLNGFDDLIPDDR
jgi:hypothetical protein